jgi:nitroreductase
MDVLEAIRTRRTAGKIRPDVPPRDLIEEIIEAATWAPNHRLNEPWRFFVVAGDARERFGELMAADACRDLDDPSGEKARGIAEAQMKKATRSPVIIAVACDPPSSSKIDPVEDVCAVACAEPFAFALALAPDVVCAFVLVFRRTVASSCAFVFFEAFTLADWSCFALAFA